LYTWAVSFWYNRVMATTIYDTGWVTLVNGESIHIKPLKIKYLRDFMPLFENIKLAKNDEETIEILVACTLVCMRQYKPELNTVELIEDNFDIPTIYKILDWSAGVRIKDNPETTVKQQAQDSDNSWDKLDLAELESEVFLIGIWKDFEELEESLSMPELVAVLESSRKQQHNHHRFLAAIQGVDLDKESGNQNAWEDMKARVFSGGKATDGNDVVALQGANAAKVGFGIGMGLGYEDLTKKA
jgi:hypothetical protein